MSEPIFLAVDLGASSGRVVAGHFSGNRIALEELYRFENGAVSIPGGLYWNALGLWKNIREGLRAAAGRYGQRIRSLGIDTWGVDFALLGRDDVLLENPHSYRDARTRGMMERACASLSRQRIFAQTGVQFLPFNTLYQLLAMKTSHSPVLEMAESFLMMPDLFHWFLTGVKANEFTNATTTQFLDPTTRAWADDLLKTVHLPRRILGEIVHPGTRLGKVAPHIASELGLCGVEVVLPGTHDTASAVLAVPSNAATSASPNWCYLSSGTWSLLGAEVPQPVLTDRCLELGFTNEGGVGNTVRLLKNITGLWLLQECRRAWRESGRDHSWDDLNRLASAAPELLSLVNPDAEAFQSPCDMPQAIREFCRQTSQIVPRNEGAVIRCAIDSLALRYRQVLTSLEQLTNSTMEVIHVVGGGSQNQQLCQATADACARRVLAGPVEATALGNVMVQALAMGEVGSIAQAREVIRHSFPLVEYLPRNVSAWNESVERFERISKVPFEKH